MAILSWTSSNCMETMYFKHLQMATVVCVSPQGNTPHMWKTETKWLLSTEICSPHLASSLLHMTHPKYHSCHSLYLDSSWGKGPSKIWQQREELVTVLPFFTAFWFHPSPCKFFHLDATPSFCTLGKKYSLTPHKWTHACAWRSLLTTYYGLLAGSSPPRGW